jgi:hypothetical protein
MHRSVLRLVQAAILAIGVSVIPLATVTACSCAFSELDEAIATAEVAIVGTAASVEPTGNANLGEGMLTTWMLTGSRDPIATGSLAIHSVKDSGANCGISFGMNERWLVLAYRGEQGLETNGCMMNRRLDGSDPEAESLITEAMDPVAVETQIDDPGLSIPMPIIGLGAAAMLVALVSLVAFRRSTR